MITALHALLYSDDAAATRAFFRDVLQRPFVSDPASSTDGDWLIFQTGPSELGVHPTSGPGYATPRHQSISLMCDDLEATMRELGSRGAEFTSEPADRGFGVVVMMRVPGADDVMLYEPRHPVAHSLQP